MAEISAIDTVCSACGEHYMVGMVGASLWPSHECPKPHKAVPYEHVGGAFRDFCEECKRPLNDPLHGPFRGAFADWNSSEDDVYNP